MSTLHSPPQVAPLFAALGDPTRLDLVARLGNGAPLSITKLTGTRHISRQAVTKHLKTLEQAGLVIRIRRGRESRYSLQPEAFDLARDYLDAISRQWDDALGRLRAFVED